MLCCPVETQVVPGRGRLLDLTTERQRMSDSDLLRLIWCKWKSARIWKKKKNEDWIRLWESLWLSTKIKMETKIVGHLLNFIKNEKASKINKQIGRFITVHGVHVTTTSRAGFMWWPCTNSNLNFIYSSHFLNSFLPPQV